jgi:hypothetical protein
VREEDDDEEGAAAAAALEAEAGREEYSSSAELAPAPEEEGSWKWMECWALRDLCS